MVEAAPDAIVITNRDGEIVLVNTQAERLFGFRRLELLGRRIETLIPERYHRAHLGYRSEYMSTPRARPMGSGLELFGRRKDGAEFPVEVSLSPVEADGRMLVISIIRDVTQRKRAEAERAELLVLAQAARKEAEETATTLRRLQMISDTALTHLSLPALLQELLDRLRVAMVIDTGAILLLDTEHDVLTRRAATGLEATGDQVILVPIGHGFAGRVAAEGRPVALADLDQVELVNPDLREHQIRSLLGVPLRVQDRLLGVLHVGTLTRREFTAADINFLQLAANRAALAIENALLYQQSQQAVQAREAFLSMAAHELKTPLTTVMGWAALLTDAIHHPEHSDAAAISSFTDELESQVQRLDTLIDDLLDASRIQQDRLELQPERTDLASLLRRVLTRFEHASERRPTHQLVFENSTEVVGWWDPIRVEQIATNLISNALKYSPDGGEIHVTVALVGAQAELVVQDQGIGMRPEEAEHLFEPFRRTDTARRVASGTGLGLHI
ncbi:MAG TPA: PAS domain S-box protein, partial [Thermomicrobiaceae bacterium]|nr:PAS domain S-box protein [Thermomicrobiaceae bacterium]